MLLRIGMNIWSDDAMPTALLVAYAGFWKGGRGGGQEIWEEQRSESEIVPSKISSIFCSKLGKEQKRKRKKSSSLIFSPIFRPKLGEEQKQKKNKKRSSLKLSAIFCPKLDEEQKKKSSPQFPPILSPNVGESLEETHRTYPLCDQTLCPTSKGGGACLN